MRSGTLKWFDPEKGFGFITPSDGGEDVFVRKEAMDAAGFGDLAPGATVSFNVLRSDDGLHAIDLAIPA